jgi:hypothetical protein
MRKYILAALAAAGIGLGGTFGASAVSISGNILDATAPALQKAYYYRRAYRRGYYPRYDGYGYYGGYPSYYYGYPGDFYRRYYYRRYW